MVAMMAMAAATMASDATRMAAGRWDFVIDGQGSIGCQCYQKICEKQ